MHFVASHNAYYYLCDDDDRYTIFVSLFVLKIDLKNQKKISTKNHPDYTRDNIIESE